MGGMSLREKAIASALGMALLYALAVGLWFWRQEGEWKKASKAYNTARLNYQNECKLIGEKQKWNDRYEDEKSAMPMFAEGKATDTTWQRKMDELAEKHHISISTRQSGEEVAAGEVLELPIEVKSWEGALEPLVKFMHELENTSEGMFDIRALSFRPSAKKGYLKGSFTLTCAYMREK